MAEIYVNPETGEVYQQNDTITRPVLGRTFERIAAEGANILYEDTDLMKAFVKDLQDMGGNITEEDMLKYT